MANEIIIPFAIPVKFSKMNFQNIPQYVSKFLDDFLFEQTIPDWFQKKSFLQTWGMDDAIRLQVKSNYGPITLKIYKCDGQLLNSEIFENRQQDYFRPGYYIRQIELDTADYDPGQYYFTITAGNSTPWVSEPQLFKENIIGTLYIEYSHYEKYGEIYFQSPYSPTIRVPAAIYYDSPGAKDTIYEDQQVNQELIKSVPFDVYKFIMGGSPGCPPWLMKKINRIFGVSDLKIDGRYFTKAAEGAAWEKTEQERYPMNGWSLNLRERFNEEAGSYQDDVALTGNNNMVATIDSAGFGVDDEGDDFLEIEILR